MNSQTMPYKNKEDRARNIKKYQQSSKYKLYDWRRQGIHICEEDEMDIYNRYMNTNTCDLCNVSLVLGGRDSRRKCIEHDHLSGEFRSICCNKCNMYMRKHDNMRVLLCLEIHRYFILKK